MKIDTPSSQASEQTGDAIFENAASPAAPLALIVGLGNPGSEYASHRHNVGFMVIDSLAKSHGLSFARHKAAKARVAEGHIGARRVLLAKPQTFMNLSGKTVLRLHRERQIPPERILVVCDDLDLPLGRLRIRPEGGSGGQKGLRSIIDLLNSQDFARLRVGIDRPAGSLDPAEYVLQPFAKEERAMATDALERAVLAVETWLVAGVVTAMDRFNSPPPAAGEAPDENRIAEESAEAPDDAGEPVPLSLSPARLQLPPDSQETVL